MMINSTAIRYRRAQRAYASIRVFPLTGVTLLWIVLLGWGCQEEDNVGPDYDIVSVDTVAVSQYTLTVSSSLHSEASVYQGTNTTWLPDIGHIELGPDETGGDPIASLWLTLDPQGACSDICRICHSQSEYFYSVERPGADIGDQDAYSYDPTRVVQMCLKAGIDRNGENFIAGQVSIEFERQPPLIGEHIPENITVFAVFTAIHD